MTTVSVFRIPVTVKGEEAVVELPGAFIRQLERFVWANPVRDDQTVRVTGCVNGAFAFEIGPKS